MQWILDRIEENQAVFTNTAPHPVHGWIEIFTRFSTRFYHFDDFLGYSYRGETVEQFDIHHLEDEEQNIIDFKDFDEYALFGLLNNEIEKNYHRFSWSF